jgi:surface antigen
VTWAPTCTRRLRKFARRLSLVACVGTLAAVAAPAGAQAQVYTFQWEPSAVAFWSVNSSTIMSVFQNGQCTELAANTRPDVVQAIIEGAIGSELAQGQTNESMPDMDARYWTAEASAVGLATGNAPRRGALMVFQPGVLGAGSAGHIAYVQRVNRNGSFRIAQMHAPLLYQVTYQTLPRRAARLAGVSFVY